jgi:glycosyltransferase involved in cell wall biosynthesis
MHSILGGFGTLLRGVDPITGWRRWPVEWTAVSHTGAADLSRALGEGRSVTVLPNAIDVDRWRIDQPAPHDDVHIVAVMRLARRKRPLPLLEMLRCVRERVPDDVALRATIIGDGPRHRSMARALTTHGMGPWVDLPGRLDHDAIRHVFRTADLFVAPAVRESFGIAALEARAAGLPVIAMERSGIAEFVEHERSGLLASDDAAMVRSICALVTDRRLRAAIIEHNRSTRPQYSWDRAVAATAALYRAAERRQLGRSLERNIERRVQIGVA